MYSDSIATLPALTVPTTAVDSLSLPQPLVRYTFILTVLRPVAHLCIPDQT